MDALNEALQKVFNGQCCGWNNVLDILIVAVCIYYVLVLMRGPRAVQLVLGVLGLVAIYGLAVLLKLELRKFVLSAVFAFAVFALLIVFQPELRRALGQLGQLGPLNRLLVQQPEEEVDHVVDELVRAALLIAEARHGALIVVERSTGLQDYSETGVPVHGKLTAELLASIFMTRSPLHDGAVIVRGGQILAAACLLPLEETPERAAHRYGMRHRAAAPSGAAGGGGAAPVAARAERRPPHRHARLSTEGDRGRHRDRVLGRDHAEHRPAADQRDVRRTRSGRTARQRSRGLRATRTAPRCGGDVPRRARCRGPRRAVGSARLVRRAGAGTRLRRSAGRASQRDRGEGRRRGDRRFATHRLRAHRAPHPAHPPGAPPVRD